MAIVFQSQQDPWGLSALGSAFGQGFQKTKLLQEQERQKIAGEEREQQKKIATGSLLADALKIASDPNQTNEARSAALQQFITQTGDTSVVPMLKDLGKDISREKILDRFGLGLNKNQQPQNQSQIENTQQNAPAQRTIKDLNEDELIGLAGSGDQTIKSIVDSEFKRRDLVNKQFNEDRKFHERGAKQSIESVRNLRMSLPKKEFAARLARDAILSDEVGAFSWNNLSEIFGRKEFLSAKGAQLVAASKENLFSNISKVSAKAQNQWLEQRMASQFPEIGKSKEANLTMDAILQGEIDMDKAYVDAFTRLQNEDLQKYGYERKDIDARAEKEVEPIYQKIMDRTSYLTRQQYEAEKGVKFIEDNIMKKVPRGTMFTPMTAKIMAKQYNGDFKKAVENAKKLGYTIPTVEEVKSWQ